MAQFWPEARRHVAKALQYTGGTHDHDDVFAAIVRGDMQLFIGPHSALVTEMVHYPKFNAVRFFCAGGDFAELNAMQKEVCRLAKETGGIKRVEFGGRAGWGLKLEGYTELGRYFTKELEG